MPQLPMRWCARCRTTHADECPNKPRRWDNKRQPSGRGGRAWRRKREAIFERDSYLCQIHLQRGKYKPVMLHGPNHGVLDHIIPKHLGGTDDESNLQTICQRCNDQKTSEEGAKARKNAHKAGKIDVL